MLKVSSDWDDEEIVQEMLKRERPEAVQEMNEVCTPSEDGKVKEMFVNDVAFEIEIIPGLKATDGSITTIGVSFESTDIAISCVTNASSRSNTNDGCSLNFALLDGKQVEAAKAMVAQGKSSKPHMR